MSEVQVRLARSDDAEMIVALLHAAFDEYRSVLNPPSGVQRETVESVREKMRTGAWLIAEDKGVAVGCVFSEPRGEFLYLGRLGVLPPARGRGVGRALMQLVETTAREQGFSRVRLGVRVILSDLRAMYERQGYRVVEYHTHEGFSEPTFVMLEKEL
jgi:predicted N-acetyltransferase YhbS